MKIFTRNCIDKHKPKLGCALLSSTPSTTQPRAKYSVSGKTKDYLHGLGASCVVGVVVQAAAVAAAPVEGGVGPVRVVGLARLVLGAAGVAEPRPESGKLWLVPRLRRQQPEETATN